jgi:hypothetical protein
VEDIQFDGGHTVDRAEENVNRHEVPSAVDHQAAPAKTRSVVNRYCGKKISRYIRLHKLLQSFETVHGSDDCSGVKVRAGRGDFKRVGLVFIDRLNGFSSSIDTDNERRGCARRWRRRLK